MLQRAFVGAQLFELVLGEIADVERLGFLAFAALLGDGAGQQLDQCRFAGAVAAEQADAAAGAQGNVDFGQNLPLTVTGTGIFDGEQRVGQGARLAEAEMEGRVDVRGGNNFHALQHLDPALCLAGLGRLGLEAFDEAAEVGNLALLCFVGRLLRGEAGGAVLLIGRDAPQIRAALQDAGVPLRDADDMAGAVALARERAQPGDAVLLSPACASLDMYANYVARADAFRAAVRDQALAAGVELEMLA